MDPGQGSTFDGLIPWVCRLTKQADVFVQQDRLPRNFCGSRKSPNVFSAIVIQLCVVTIPAQIVDLQARSGEVQLEVALRVIVGVAVTAAGWRRRRRGNVQTAFALRGTMGRWRQRRGRGAFGNVCCFASKPEASARDRAASDGERNLRIVYSDSSAAAQVAARGCVPGCGGAGCEGAWGSTRTVNSDSPS